MTISQTQKQSIEDWLVQRVDEYETGGDTPVNASTPLTDLGFSSVYALTLCGDIEDHYGLEIEPSLLWDQRTIGELANTLATLLGDAQG